MLTFFIFKYSDNMIFITNKVYDSTFYLIPCYTFLVKTESPSNDAPDKQKLLRKTSTNTNCNTESEGNHNVLILYNR